MKIEIVLALIRQKNAQISQGRFRVVPGALMQPLLGLFGPVKNHRLHIQDFILSPDGLLKVVLTKTVIEPQDILKEIFAISIHKFFLSVFWG
jgi:hypothetical protein